MKGIMFILLEDFIVSKYGEGKYEEIITACHTDAFNPFEIVSPGSYPDEIFGAIISTASAKINIETSEMLKDMGRHSLPRLADRYPHFFNAYEHPRDFLKTASMIHQVEVKKLYQGAEVPSFFIENLKQNSLTLIYKSRRQLCHLVEGLVTGLGDYYNIAVSANQTECAQAGGKVCKFEVTFHNDDSVPTK